MDETNGHFKKITPDLIEGNVFKLIGSDGMLITAGILGDYNTMTASGGGWGTLWKKRTCFCIIKPEHYTYQFMERFPYFTFSFFAEQYRSALQYCGRHSGREVDKAAAVGITPVAGTAGAVYFAEARLVIECKKIYVHDIDPANFIDPQIHQNRYPDKDYHRLYVGEVVGCLVKEK